MECCKQVALPLAQAICNNLKKQDVEVNVAILTSYLLETYPDSLTRRDIVNDMVVEKQIDQQGRVGDVSFHLEKCQDAGDVRLLRDHEYLLVHRRDREVRCVLLREGDTAEHTLHCSEGATLGNTIAVDSKKRNTTLYKVKARWVHNDELYTSEEEDDGSIVVIDGSLEEEESFLLLEEKRKVAVGRLDKSLVMEARQLEDDELEMIKVTENTDTWKVTEGADTKEAMNWTSNENTEISLSEQQILDREEEIRRKQKYVAAAVSTALEQRRDETERRGSAASAIQASVRGNWLKKVLVIGKTGTGKSSLCNVLTGNLPNSKVFPVSAKATTCTQETTFANAYFCGDPSKPLSLIDTIGFDDPTKDHDAKIIAELVLQLQHNCDYINTFVMAVNGQNPRLDGSLLSMIKIFEKMFTKKFWDQTVVVFTRLHMDQASKARRLEESDGATDDDLAKEYLAQVEEVCGVNSSQLNYLFIDSQYRKTDFDETQAFNVNTEKLFQHVMTMLDLPTSEVTTVMTENEKLWSTIHRLRVAAGVAAGSGMAALGVATVKSAIAETAIKEAARAVAEKAVAETATAAARAELAKAGQELATMALTPVARAATEHGGLVAAIPVVLGVLAAVVAWGWGVPLPPIP